MSNEFKKCCAHLNGRYYATCQNAAKVNRDGKDYCGIHDPVRLLAAHDERIRLGRLKNQAIRERDEKDWSERRMAKRKAAAFDVLLSQVIEARHALQVANDDSDGPISDTIWMDGHETLFDFMDGAIEKAKESMK